MGMYGGKYVNLYKFLNGKEKKVQVVTLTFLEIEEILGFTLPDSAFKYTAQWWANDETHVQAHAWSEAGWKAFPQKNGKHIAFMRGRKVVKFDQRLVDAAKEQLMRRFLAKAGML